MSLHVQFRIVSTWSQGFQAEIVITNGGQVPMLRWVLCLTPGWQILEIWNARYDGQGAQGDSVCLHPEGSAPLHPGQSSTIGLIASGAPLIPCIKSCWDGGGPPLLQPLPGCRC